MNTEDFTFKKHPHELFVDWYLSSMGKSKNQKLSSQLKVKFNYFLKTVFTQFVPSLDRMQSNAFVLATSSADGVAASRVVLLKDYSEQGYVFYTNYNSAKSKDILSNPKASLNFFWSYPTRQVRIVGDVEKVPAEVSAKYWSSRPRGSQEGALASQQSTKIESYKSLCDQLERVRDQYAGKDIPCPEHWGGFIVKPISYEFWKAMPNRLHQRVRFKKANNDSWDKDFLAP